MSLTHQDLMKLILPDYNINMLTVIQGFNSIYSCHNRKVYIFKSKEDKQMYKMEFVSDLDPRTVTLALINIELYKNWHPEVNDGHVKMQISS